MSIPPQMITKGPKYKWSRLNKPGGWVSGVSPQSLRSCAESYFRTSHPEYQFRVEKQKDGTFRIYRK